jgi:hypothetical protein
MLSSSQIQISPSPSDMDIRERGITTWWRHVLRPWKCACPFLMACRCRCSGSNLKHPPLALCWSSSFVYIFWTQRSHVTETHAGDSFRSVGSPRLLIFAHVAQGRCSLLLVCFFFVGNAGRQKGVCDTMDWPGMHAGRSKASFRALFARSIV